MPTTRRAQRLAALGLGIALGVTLGLAPAGSSMAGPVDTYFEQVTVRTQTELAAALATPDLRRIVILAPATGLRVEAAPANPQVELVALGIDPINQGIVHVRAPVRLVARGTAHVWAYGRAEVDAFDHARVTAFDNARVNAFDQTFVHACDQAEVATTDHAQVGAFNHAQVMALSQSRVIAFDQAEVATTDHARVVAFEAATVNGVGENLRIWITDPARADAEPGTVRELPQELWDNTWPLSETTWEWLERT